MLITSSRITKYNTLKVKCHQKDKIHCLQYEKYHLKYKINYPVTQKHHAKFNIHQAKHSNANLIDKKIIHHENIHKNQPRFKKCDWGPTVRPQKVANWAPDS